VKIQGFELHVPNIFKLFIGFLIFIAPLVSSAGAIHDFAKEKNFGVLLTAIDMLPLQQMEQVLESVDEANTTLRSILTKYGQEGRAIIKQIDSLVAQAYAASDVMDTKAEPASRASEDSQSSRKHKGDFESSLELSTRVAKKLRFDSASINEHLAGTSLQCETKFPSGENAGEEYRKQKKERERVRLEAKQLAEILKERVDRVTSRTNTSFPMQIGTHFNLVLAGTKLNCRECGKQSIVKLRCPEAHGFCLNCVAQFVANRKFWTGAGSGSFDSCPFCRWTRSMR